MIFTVLVALNVFDLSNVYQIQLAILAGMLEASCKGVCGVHGGNTVNAGFDGISTDKESVSCLITALSRGINNKVYLMS